MKSRIAAPFNKRQRDVLADEVNKVMFECVNKNFNTVMLTLIECYGWRKERCAKFIRNFNDIFKKVKRWDEDGVFEHEMKSVFEEIGLEYGCFDTEALSCREVAHRQRLKAKERAISDAEKIKITELRNAFQFAMSKGENNELISD